MNEGVCVKACVNVCERAFVCVRVCGGVAGCRQLATDCVLTTIWCYDLFSD